MSRKRIWVCSTHAAAAKDSPKDALLDVFPGAPELKAGYVYANESPGLGIDINEFEAAKYPCGNPVVTWTQTRLPDGSLHTP